MLRTILVGMLVTASATGCAKNRAADEPDTRIRDTAAARDTVNPNDTLPHIRDSVPDSTRH
jgi:predicted component of type VI protein secretion system